jgi:hypothetical protein
MQAELEALLSENAELSAKCDELERHLLNVATALEDTLNLYIERNKGAKQENLELEEEIDRKEALIGQTKSLLTDLCHCGWDLTSSGHLNLEHSTRLFDGRLPQSIEGCDQFDPIVYHIVSTTPYFKGCDSNDSFLARSSELVAAIAELNDGNGRTDVGFDEDDYETKLRMEQIAFQREFAHEAVGTKKLIDEQGRLKSVIDRVRATSRPGSRNHSGSRSGSGSSGSSRNSPKSSLFL